jgi:hypothetical protein
MLTIIAGRDSGCADKKSNTKKYFKRATELFKNPPTPTINKGEHVNFVFVIIMLEISATFRPTPTPVPTNQ